VTALSMSERWDLQLARSKDSCRLQGKYFNFSSVTLTAVTTTVNVATLTTGTSLSGSLGNRAYNIGRNYTRYRINKLLVRAYPQNSAVDVDTLVAFSFIDDPSSIQPTTFSDIAEMRASRTALGNRQDSANLELVWTPIDKSKWYYVLDDNSSLSDARLSSPCSFIAITATSGGTCTFSLYYDITFEGATDPQ